MAVSGTHAYVADDYSGLQVIDITNPASPQIVGSVDTPGGAMDVAVSGTYAYVADDRNGLQVIDVTNPMSPSIVGAVDPGSSGKVACSDAYVYLVGLSIGLRIAPAQCMLESSVGENHLVPANMSLKAYPNPGSSRVSIHFESTEAGLVRAGVTDVTGRQIRQLFHGVLSRGDHTIMWDGSADDGGTIPAGVYLVWISTAEGTEATRYVALR